MEALEDTCSVLILIGLLRQENSQIAINVPTFCSFIEHLSQFVMHALVYECCTGAFS